MKPGNGWVLIIKIDGQARLQSHAFFFRSFCQLVIQGGQELLASMFIGVTGTGNAGRGLDLDFQFVGKWNAR